MSQQRGLYLLVLVNLIWGASYVVAKVALETLPPTLLAALRFTVATVLLWGVLLWQARRQPNALPPFRAILPQDRRRIMGLGLYGLGAGYLLGYWGVNLTTATDASLMIIGEVIFTTLLAALLAGEQIGRWRRAGIALGVVGVAILVLGSAAEATDELAGRWRMAGNLLVLAGIASQAFYSVWGAGLAWRIPPLTMIAYAYAGSMLLWLPILLWHLVTGPLPAINLVTGLGVVYLAVLPSLVCFVIWFRVIRTTGASLGALSLFVQPVMGAFLGIWLLDDPITFSLLTGGALIFVALILTTLPDRSLRSKTEAAH